MYLAKESVSPTGAGTESKSASRADLRRRLLAMILKNEARRQAKLR